MAIITVSMLNQRIKSLLMGDHILSALMVEGEISNFKNHFASGHFYFSIKDAGAAMRCVMFKSSAARLGFMPEDGMNVIIKGSVSLFERDGSTQIYVSDILPSGEGKLQLIFDQLKEKLEKEGLFFPLRKKSLPLYPKIIGIVTAKTGAALQDMLNILDRRYPLAEVRLFPALVQGPSAPAAIIEGIKALDEAVDVIIIGRGGGSIEDLWGFNDEGVARAIFAAKTPIISAVGHETDFTIADFVADLRAPTPSAAAELVAPDISNIREDVAARFLQISILMERKIWKLRSITNEKRAKTSAEGFALALENKAARLRSFKLEFRLTIRAKIKAKEEELKRLMLEIDLKSPIKILSRGYSLVRKDETLISSAGQIMIGDELNIRFSSGEAAVKVIDIKESDV